MPTVDIAGRLEDNVLDICFPHINKSKHVLLMTVFGSINNIVKFMTLTGSYNL